MTGAVCNRERSHRTPEKHCQKSPDFEIWWTDIPALLLPEDYDFIEDVL